MYYNRAGRVNHNFLKKGVKVKKMGKMKYSERKSMIIGGKSLKLTIVGFWGGYPKVNEASTGYLLEHEGFRLMIDFGSGVLAKLQNFVQPEELDALVLSHYHPITLPI
ncbi:metal-dependent hydrolase [Mesobacillus boroniphilus JCM 21738]|uniref:Metal-dependent hydrolase n=1 Tax=Mesobacillus boroniphilus JCM 21738 TaxID=1294265 RepID=W4RRJ6_9BACI|nr:metal-dependent hydrolase [Mesobacillus boroniphilus JCM 21738]